VIIIMLTTPAACAIVPMPDVGHLSGRAVIADNDIETLEAGEGVITRKNVLLMLGEPNERYNRDEYFCYAWERIIGLWFVAGAGAYGPPFIFGDFIGKDHWLCMQFDSDARLVQVEHIEPLSDAGAAKNKVLHEWNQSGSGGDLKITYDYYNLNRIKYEVIQRMAVKGIPESQWRLYDEFGKNPTDWVWVCRSADNGYARAQLEVGHIYWTATEIPQHRIKAYVWYMLAASIDRRQGKPADRETLIQADEAIREAVNTLDQSQLIEAYNSYSEWEPGRCELELVNFASQ